MEFGFTIAAYAVAAVLFILSLGGLSGQESAKARGLVRHRGHDNRCDCNIDRTRTGALVCFSSADRGRCGRRLSAGDQGANDTDAGTGCDHALAWWGWRPCLSALTLTL